MAFDFKVRADDLMQSNLARWNELVNKIGKTYAEQLEQENLSFMLASNLNAYYKILMAEWREHIRRTSPSNQPAERV
jgi:hypothetical protein